MHAVNFDTQVYYCVFNSKVNSIIISKSKKKLKIFSLPPGFEPMQIKLSVPPMLTLKVKGLKNNNNYCKFFVIFQFGVKSNKNRLQILKKNVAANTTELNQMFTVRIWSTDLSSVQIMDMSPIAEWCII